MISASQNIWRLSADLLGPSGVHGSPGQAGRWRSGGDDWVT